MSDTQEFRASFYEECYSKSGLVMENSTTITCYRGTAISRPDFEDQDAGQPSTRVDLELD